MRLFRVAPAALLLVACAAPHAWGRQTGRAAAPPTPVTPEEDASWTTEAWTADEAPYLAARKEVEDYFRGRTPSSRHTDLYGKAESAIVQSRANPKSPVMRYRAAYYALRLLRFEGTPEAAKLASNGYDHVGVSLADLPSPRSREYARLRLLVHGGGGAPFIDLAERLYGRDPKDVDVAVRLIEIRDGTRSARGNHARSVEVAERLMKDGDPKKRPEILYAYGLAHHYSLAEEYTAEHVRKAREGYAAYMKAAPAFWPLVRQVGFLQAGIEKVVAEKGPPKP